ncbi:hypothetical protein CH371_14475 [Leptospira wolffii]|uniref:Alpha/beta hydrolase n=1 Tax=Leptospira wolffii TaxID=409998 RepID=A0A2M9Z9S1_9LEPT|nr:hypothetical protein [Leptospira wolffii]PJZ65127.1 hypothetical protein CH371_14475 [Leptospira wolffii]
MQENRWTFTSRGNPKGQEVIWLRDPFRSFDRSFSPELSNEYYLTIAESPEKSSEFPVSELHSFVKNRKRKPILVSEGFSVRTVWPFLENSPDLVHSAFLIFPQPLPVSGLSLSWIEKADWFLRNLPQVGKIFGDPFRLEKIWNGLEKDELYRKPLSVPLGILLPRTTGTSASQSEDLIKLSESLQVFRWETRNPRFSEPDTEKLSKILEAFLKSGGQKQPKAATRTRF